MVGPVDSRADAFAGTSGRFLHVEMGGDLMGLKKKSRPGGALPEAGRKDGQDKAGTPAGDRIAEMGTRSRRFPWLLALSLLLWPAAAAAGCLHQGGPGRAGNGGPLWEDGGLREGR